MKKILLPLSVVVFTAAAVFFGVQIDKRSKAAKYEETAVPYVKRVVPEISKWDLGVIREYMPPEALEGTTEERMAKIVDYLARLGELETMGEPVFTSVVVRTMPEGEKRTVNYTVDVEYANGAGVMTIGLLETNGSFQVHNFHVSSEALND